MFCPCHSHQIVLKQIGYYLKATHDKGLILNPCDELKIDVYPAVDCASLYGHEKTSDPACAKSRAGFVVNIADCPVLWISKLQTETTLSTMEAEIFALFHSCYELSPIIDIFKSLGKVVGLPTDDCRCWQVLVAILLQQIS